MKRRLVWAGGFLLLAVNSLIAQRFSRIGDLIRANRLDEARSRIVVALHSAPRDPELLYWKAALESSSGQLEEAEETLLGVIEADRASSLHYLLLAQIYGARRQWQQSADSYRQALGRKKTVGTALKLGMAEFRAGRFDASIETLRPLLEETEDNRSMGAQVHHLLGLAYLGKKDLAPAIENLLRAVRAVPSDPSFNYDLGLALLQASRVREAVRILRKVVELKPAWAQAHLYLGRALHDSNYSDNALLEFHKAENLKPGLPLLHYHYGLLYQGRGENDRAIQEFERELSAGSLYPPLYYHLADLLSKRQERQRSRRMIQRAIQLDSHQARFHLLAAKLSLEEGALAEAEGEVDQALRLEPESNQAYYLKGRVLQAQGRSAEALTAFERSRRLGDRKGGRVPH